MTVVRAIRWPTVSATVVASAYGQTASTVAGGGDRRAEVGVAVGRAAGLLAVTVGVGAEVPPSVEPEHPATATLNPANPSVNTSRTGADPRPSPAAGPSRHPVTW